jgi:hypothetical protein
MYAKDFSQSLANNRHATVLVVLSLCSEANMFY